MNSDLYSVQSIFGNNEGRTICLEENGEAEETGNVEVNVCFFPGKRLGRTTTKDNCEYHQL